MVSLGVAIFITYVKPFERPIVNFIESFNEVCFIGLTVTFYAFTEQYEDSTTKWNAGWATIFIVVGCFAINLCLIVYDIIIALKEAYIDWKIKRHAKKHGIQDNVSATEGQLKLSTIG